MKNGEVVSREEEKQEKQHDQTLGYFRNDRDIEPSACVLLRTLLLGGVAGAAARGGDCVAWGGKKSKGSFAGARPVGPGRRLPLLVESELVVRDPRFPGRLRSCRGAACVPHGHCAGWCHEGGGGLECRTLAPGACAGKVIIQVTKGRRLLG